LLLITHWTLLIVPINQVDHLTKECRLGAMLGLKQIRLKKHGYKAMASYE